MRRRFLSKTEKTKNVIFYTSTDENIVTPYDSSVFGATIIDNTYEDGQGVIYFADEVTKIGIDAFRRCATLLSINIPENVTSIGNNAFRDCSNLTDIIIPDNITSLGTSLFANCKSIQTLTIPDSVSSIGGYLAFNCPRLEEVKGKFTTEDGRCIILNNTLNTFAPYGLTSYVIPNYISKIGSYAFYNCDKMENIVIPDSVTVISAYSFLGCKALTSITLPSNITTIENDAFNGCSKLIEVFCSAVTPPKLLNSNTFSNNHSDRIIYVPTDSVDLYKSATNWNAYADKIVGYNFNS